MRCESCNCILDGSPYCFSSKENPAKCEGCVKHENQICTKCDGILEKPRTNHISNATCQKCQKLARSVKK